MNILLSLVQILSTSALFLSLSHTHSPRRQRSVIKNFSLVFGYFQRRWPAKSQKRKQRQEGFPREKHRNRTGATRRMISPHIGRSCLRACCRENEIDDKWQCFFCLRVGVCARVPACIRVGTASPRFLEGRPPAFVARSMDRPGAIRGVPMRPPRPQGMYTRYQGDTVVTRRR